jgi:hypothetical protein
VTSTEKMGWVKLASGEVYSHDSVSNDLSFQGDVSEKLKMETSKLRSVDASIKLRRAVRRVPTFVLCCT